MQEKRLAWAGIVLGLFFLGAIWVWENVFLGPGGGNAADRLYLGFFRFVAWLCLLIGIGDMLLRLGRIRQRAAALKPSGVFGDARFATATECYDAGLMDPKGLYLGTMKADRQVYPLFYSGKAHLLTVAPARSGKGVGVVIPNLLHYQGSVFVTDPKGELASVTRAHRAERFSQKVYVLNPWGLHDLPQDRYNPLAPLIEAAGDEALIRGLADEARALALQLLPEPDDARNRYFRDGARNILRAVMLHLATRGDPDTCTLPQMWRVLSSQKRLTDLIADMAGSTALGGMVADLGDDLSHQVADNEEQFQDFRQGAVQALEIFDPASWLADAVAGSDVDFKALKEGRATVYLVIPQDRIATHGAWLGLVTRQAISAVTRSHGDTPVLFLLDEFANMGKLEGLAESLTGLPGLGVRVWAIVQELAELKRIYGPETAQTIASQAEVKQFFAVQNDALLRQLSQALGQRTVKTRNYNLGRSLDTDISESLSETGRPLMSPEEIRQMDDDEQLLLIKALLPVRANRPPFWCIKPWAEWAGANPVEGTPPKRTPVASIPYVEKSNKAASKVA